MTHLTGSGILNDAMSMMQDQGATLRAKCLIWLNVTAQKLAVVRPWLFLETSFTRTMTGETVIIMPSDFAEFKSLQAGNSFTFDQRNKLTDGEAWTADNSQFGYVTPAGYTEGTTTVDPPTFPPGTIHPPVDLTRKTIILHGAGYTGSVVVNYRAEPPAIIDSTDFTLWPTQCRSVFMEAVLAAYTKYDMDERFIGQLQISATELAELKKWDNSQKPKTQYSRRGYRRTR